MALRSWLQQASSSLLSFPTDDNEHELPYWDYHAVKMSSSVPPPPPTIPPAPVTASVHASTVRLKQTRALPENMLLLRRREQQLHDELQDLLDAQEEALSRESIGGQEDADLSGSLTPTVHSLAGKTTPERQQPRRKIGIGSARKGIRRAMRQLAAVKDEEGHLLDKDKAKKNAVLEKLAGWEEQRAGLEKQIQDIEHSNQESRTEALKEEAHTLEGEIHELEQKLRDMKARHRTLISEISGIENAVQSKLSSYKTSLSLLESDISVFLQSKRPRDQASSTAPFFSIHPKRRTLSMAKEHWQEQLSDIEKQQKDTETERAALEEGALIWHDIVHRVADFEKKIASATLHYDPYSDSTAEAKELLSQLEDTIHYIDTKHEMAQERGWTLLVCCIGAELSALHQGQNILESMLAAAQGQSSANHSEGEQEAEGRHSDVDVGFQPSMAHSGGMNGDVVGAQERKSVPVRQVTRHYHTDEDEPDPELLISHQDTDDE